MAPVPMMFPKHTEGAPGPSQLGTGDLTDLAHVTMDATTVNQYLYDGEGRICAVSSTPVPGFTTMTGYVYDAEGNRVAKGTITSMSCDPSVNGLMTANNETDYVLGPGGEQVTELAQDANGTMNWQRTYVYAGGAIIATYEPNPDNQTQPLPSFRLTDWLGTLRATTDAYGVAQGTCTGLPFGDGVTCSGDIPDNHHFTGKERDTESGNDYFGARYYASSMGRWLSPDWSAKEEPVPYAKMDDPQSLNLYVYVLNNPMTGIDKDGHECGGPGQAACRAKSEPGDQQAPRHDANHTHTLTVRYVSGLKGNPAGHITVQVDGNKEVGFGPVQDMTHKQVAENASVPGKVEPRDPNAKTLDSVTIYLTGDEANHAQANIDLRNANPGNYQPDGRSCVDLGETVVHSTGAAAPNDLTPKYLIKDLRDLQNKAGTDQAP